MSLRSEVRTVCEFLVDNGWNPLFQRHGFDLAAAVKLNDDRFAQKLESNVAVDRQVPGFEDFTTAGTKLIEPGRPAASLLFHAMASPRVHPDGGPAPTNSTAYPALDQIDTVENYIYSRRRPDLGSLINPAIVVFAYQYRPGSRTAHGQHADFVYSRCGVARVGTRPHAYAPATRDFQGTLDGEGISVLPARYAAFIAEQSRPHRNSAIMVTDQFDRADRNRIFAFPVHKLFAGKECLEGADLLLEFDEFHLNEKLNRVHSRGGVQVVGGFDINKYPFIRDSRNSGDLVKLSSAGSSVLVVPIHQEALVRTVEQLNQHSDKTEIVRFLVPSKTRGNRFSTSLMLPSDPNGARRAPEYVNIRHKVVHNNGKIEIHDLKDATPQDFERHLEEGRYEAAHFIDDSCDGALDVVVKGMPGPRTWTVLPAFSLVTAPDFLPMADQITITQWAEKTLSSIRDQFRQGRPDPLSDGRRPANLNLGSPTRPGAKAFGPGEETIVAVVGTPPLSRGQDVHRDDQAFVSYMTDAASNEFAPGWDVSLATDGLPGDERGNVFYASHGLGSPFPEDAKLCAALNSYWPAVAPDASRTFGLQFAPTAIPMLDAELGYNRSHPLVRAGRVAPSIGWDGETGPFFDTVDGRRVVNFASLPRSDYVTNSLNGSINLQTAMTVGSSDLIDRMVALSDCVGALPPDDDRVSNTKLWLVRAEKIDDWNVEGARSNQELKGAGFIYEFVRIGNNERTDRASTPVNGDPSRLLYPVTESIECQLSADLLLFKSSGDTHWTPVSR